MYGSICEMTKAETTQQTKNETRILDQMVINVNRAESTKRAAIKNAAEDLKRIGTSLNMISQMIKKRAKEMDVTEDYIGRCLPPELKDQAQRQVALAKYHDGRTQGLPEGTAQLKVTKKRDIKILRQEVKVLRNKDLDKDKIIADLKKENEEFTEILTIIKDNPKLTDKEIADAMRKLALAKLDKQQQQEVKVKSKKSKSKSSVYTKERVQPWKQAFEKIFGVPVNIYRNDKDGKIRRID